MNDHGTRKKNSVPVIDTDIYAVLARLWPSQVYGSQPVETWTRYASVTLSIRVETDWGDKK